MMLWLFGCDRGGPDLTPAEVEWRARFDENDAACGLRFSTACDHEACAGAIEYPNNLPGFIWKHPRRFAMSALYGLHPRTKRCEQVSLDDLGRLTVRRADESTIFCLWDAPDRAAARWLCAEAAVEFGGRHDVASVPDDHIQWEDP